MNEMKLEADFYFNPDVVLTAKLLIGKVLFSKKDGELTAGVITETEAYRGIEDRASHAYSGRKTVRTEVMYRSGGTAYVYLCYGIHSLFNVVSNLEGIPHAVLIRAIEPFMGEDIMLKRRDALQIHKNLFNGPGKVCEAMGIHHSQSGISLFGNELWIEDKGITYPNEQIKVTPRIGVEYAGKDALLPYRFVVR